MISRLNHLVLLAFELVVEKLYYNKNLFLHCRKCKKISIRKIDDGDFGLASELALNFPEISLVQALELVEQERQLCSYS
jgi:hypothetical protein